ncbi:hypothetical protein FIBSPDRAFT_900294 [Athelia psychrophila]|uniref:Uncharacterized protein n=1 Tax=Athelia psychrophila TaxID=1759441 RepID=A0A165YLM3_9AGAM|nr:hypothetical protein FIBSPDRAFT_900294 [Fibularhizoctonia sp. CBS 109695]
MPDNLVSDMLGSASDNVVRATMYLRCSYVAGIFLRDLWYDRPAAGGNIRITEDDNIGVAAGGNIGMAAGDDIGMAAGNYTGIAAYNNILNLVGLQDGRNDLGRYWPSWVSYRSLFSGEFKSGPQLPWKSLDHKILAIDQLSHVAAITGPYPDQKSLYVSHHYST